MFGAVVVLWLGAAPELPQQRADIAAWLAARSLAPVAPEAAPTPSYDAALVEQIETLLEEARATPVWSASQPSSPSALERAEALLEVHPELPQAAWLLAERYALEAHALGRSEAALQRRRALLERSRALEGGRAPSAGQARVAPPSAAAGPRAAAPDAAALPAAGARPHDRLVVDGVSGAALTPGRHHVQLYRGSQRVWASWLDAGDGVELTPTDPSVACSTLDLADVSVGADAPHPAPGVRCERWLAARPAALGGTELSECTASSCGRWQGARDLGEGPGPRGTGRTRAVDGAGAWPAWATWGLVGIGAGALTGVVLWQAGAFDRSRPDTEFVFSGPSASAYRF
jgi:hypothetical protein